MERDSVQCDDLCEHGGDSRERRVDFNVAACLAPHIKQQFMITMHVSVYIKYDRKIYLI